MKAIDPATLVGATGKDIDAYRAYARASAEINAFIAIIESRTFIGECIRRGMQSALSIPVVTYSALSELSQHSHASAGLVILSLMEANNETRARLLKELSERVPGIPVIVLASEIDVYLARTAIHHGAKGYISVGMGFEIAVEAVRFVLAGGTYVPVDCLLAAGSQTSPSSSILSSRELSIVRAIQQGKQNKIIAYELNMCESTVKVHVRNIMKKLKAKNRTDVAIKTQNAEDERPVSRANQGISPPPTLTSACPPVQPPAF